MSDIIILSGPICAGKSTYANSLDRKIYTPISRDEIRNNLFGKKYKQNKRDEEEVSRYFTILLIKSLMINKIPVLDNTHCKESYIDKILQDYSSYEISIKFFDIPLWKSYYRNYIRFFKTGKWIPLSVVSSTHKNYNKINKQKYEHLLHI